MAAYTCPKCGQALCFNIFDVVNDGVCLQSHMVVCNGNLALRLPNSIIWITILTYKMVLHITRIAKEKYPCAIEMGKQAFMIVLIIAVDGSLDVLTLAGDFGYPPLAIAFALVAGSGLKAPVVVTTIVTAVLLVLILALYYPSQRAREFQTPKKRIQRDLRDWSPLGEIVEIPAENTKLSASGILCMTGIIIAAFYLQGCSYINSDPIMDYSPSSCIGMPTTQQNFISPAMMGAAIGFGILLAAMTTTAYYIRYSVVIPLAMFLQGCSLVDDESTTLYGILITYTIVVCMTSFYVGYKVNSVCCKPSGKKSQPQPIQAGPKKDSSQISEIKVKTFLDKLTVDLLKEILKRLHAPVTGLKSDLLKRVLEEIKAIRLKKED